MTTRYLLCAVCGLFFYTSHAQRIISLAGTWDLIPVDKEEAILPKIPDTGMPPKSLFTDYVTLPGSLLTNDKGNPVTVKTQWTGSLYDSSFYYNPYMEKYRKEGQMKFPFFLTPNRHYVGAAWYRRTIYVPEEWHNQHITLFLERPHIETTVYVNGHLVGHGASLSTPHRFDVTKHIKPGIRNEIVIRVYNGIENVGVGQDSHSVTDQTQGNWNGIVGRMELQAQWKKLYVKHVAVRTENTTFKTTAREVTLKTAVVSVELANHTNRFFPLWDYMVTVTIRSVSGGKPGKVIKTISKRANDAKKNKLEFTFPIDKNLKLWDEFHPNLYHLTVEAGEDIRETTFGLRDISIKDRQFYLNGHPIFLRGTVENCCFPNTGYPPVNAEEWLAIFRKCKEYGLNHVRFHSYCPPDAAFFAADCVGIYLQVEGPTWPNHGVKLRRGQVIDQYLLEESKRIVNEYGHHPSFVMMAAGNEPAGDWVTYCNDWVNTMHQYDSTRVYCGASVGGGWAWDSGSQYHVKGGARGLDWDRHAPSSDDDYYVGIEFPRNYKSQSPNQTPIVAHEQGQWCAFPDLRETSQYSGVYKARNFEIFSDLLRDNGMAEMAGRFLMASGRLQTLCYKYEMERNLRTKDYAGFQLLGLNDYSGQGTALVGPLNVFWKEKGYVSATEWRQFCNIIVPTARFPRFVYENTDTLTVPIEAYNAFYATVTDVNATYTINNTTVADTTYTVASGTLMTAGRLSIGKNLPVGTVIFPLNQFNEPTKLTLQVQFSNLFHNQWDFWVYPASPQFNYSSPQFNYSSPQGEAQPPLYPPSNSSPQIYITDSLDAKATDVLSKGGSVLLTAAGHVTLGSDVRQTYLPVFWNTSWFKMRPPHTTGAYIDSCHPLFKHGFPTDEWANLNWWELLNKAQVMNLMELPKEYQSPIQPIDTWHVSRKLGMLIEAQVLKGRLLMTTMDISNNLAQRPVARQMRKAIIAYMQSTDFQPQLSLPLSTISDFYTKQAPPVRMFTNDSPDELKPKLQP